MDVTQDMDILGGGIVLFLFLFNIYRFFSPSTYI